MDATFPLRQRIFSSRQGWRAWVVLLLRFWVAVGLIVLGSGTAGASTLTVGSEQDYPPFATGMTDATAGGFTVDLWKAVAAEAGLEYTIRVQPFHQLLEEFKAHKIDVLINLAQSDERHRFADFSVPHVVVRGAIFVRKGHAAARSEDDLSDRSIIVLRADLAHDYAVSKGWGAQLVLVDTAAEGLRMLAAGQHDAMLLSRLVGLQTVRALELTNLEALDAPAGFSQKFAFAAQHGEIELLATLNEGLAIVKANGKYDALYEKWFGVYEVREVGLRDLLKYIVPVVVFLLAWVGYLLYLRHTERNLNHAAVAATRDLLRSIVDTAPVRVFWKDHHLRYLGCNALFAKDAGLAHPQNIVGMDDFQMPWGKNAEQYRSDDRAVLVSGQAKLFYEEQQSTPDGQTIWLRSSKVPLKNLRGETIGLLGIYEDVTKQKLADETLRQLSIAVEQSPASVVITDLQARIQYVNPRFSQVTGYSAAEALGQNPRILQSHLTAKEVYADMWNTLTRGHIWHGELINHRKTGETYWEDSQIAPVKNALGVVTHYVAIKTDVTERVRSNEKIRMLMQEQQAILQNKLIGIVTVRDRTIVWANPAFEQMLGYAAGEFVGTPTRKTYPDEEAYVAFGAAAYPVLSAGGVYRSQIEQVRKDGARLWVDVSGSTLNPTTGESLWAFVDISENKRLEEIVRNQSFQDPLTQLANRRLLNDRLNQAMAASQRSACYGAVLALDLDNFKPLNDTSGHMAGDLLLVEVAHRLSQGVRQADTVARVGGDEFVVLLAQLSPDLDEAAEQTRAIAEKLRLSLAEPYLLTLQHDGGTESVVEHHCTASIGVVLFFNHDATPDAILHRADAVMYRAKDAGRNTIRYENAP